MRLTSLLFAVAVFIVILLVSGAVFVVDEREQVIITQFGKPIRSAIKDPGLYFKIPFIQKTNYFYKNLLEWDGEPGQIPTLDKTFIWVDTFARWRIVDPLKYFQTLGNEITAAQKKLDDIIDPAVRNAITSHHLIETVRNSNRIMRLVKEEKGLIRRKIAKIQKGREKLTREILQQARPKLQPFGIELVDVRFKRINYVEEVQKKVYDRMIAERKQIAELNRSEGRGQARIIEGNKEYELNRIRSEAYRKAQEIKGKADAEATKIYAEAYGKDPEFYSFLKTLELYEKSLTDNSSLILSTDSELFKYLKDYR